MVTGFNEDRGTTGHRQDFIETFIGLIFIEKVKKGHKFQ
jgi:hypothetical protein